MDFQLRTVYILNFFVIFIKVCHSFNIDMRTTVIHSGTPGSMFGFSVAEHVDQRQKWLLVGAPKQSTSQPSVENGGAVYKCKATEEESCEIVPFDTSGPRVQWNGTAYVPIEQKSNQWFGATVRSSGENGIVVACAPRYVYYSRYFDKREPVGTCFVGKLSGTRFTEYAPCRTSVDDNSRIIDQYHKQGFCMGGWSAEINKDGSTVLIGAVGSWYWQGQLFAQNVYNAQDVKDTPEGPPKDDDSYLGYSSAVGKFGGNGTKQDFVVGVPRGDGLLGKIALFDGNLQSLQNLTGDQLGAYFGYAVAAGDFNDDGRDDIAVGAPFYTNLKEMDTYETGRVYIFYQNFRNRFKFEKKTVLEGLKSASRFGLSLAALNDINLDFFQDLAVGAPYDGPNGRGAVYIYQGSRKGIKTQYSQVIFAKDLSPQLNTFGFSMSGGHDMDGNLYKDLVVGSYKSNNAVFLRTRPVVHIESLLKLSPNVLNLDKQLCHPVSDKNKNVTCFSVTACIKYYGIGLPDNLELEIDMMLDAAKLGNPRVFLLNDTTLTNKEKFTISATKEEYSCVPTNAYVKENVRDKLTPVTVDMMYKLKEAENPPRNLALPILAQDEALKATAEARILKNCGDDDVCIPDLTITASVDSHVIGSENDIHLDIVVRNRAEDAFESFLYIQLPTGVSYKNVQHLKGPVTVHCDSEEINGDEFVVCDIGNPLPQNRKVVFQLKLTAAEITGDLRWLEYSITANSSNPELNSTVDDNSKVILMPVKTRAELVISGTSIPEQVLYNSSYQVNFKSETEIGPQVIHRYGVRNLGPSSVNLTTVEILWPSYDENGMHLLYLMEVPQVVEGTGQCEVVNAEINPRKIAIDESEISNFEVNVVLKNETLFRRRREITKRAQGGQLTCEPGQCVRIICELGFMKKKEFSLIQIRSRLWTPTMVSRLYRDLTMKSQAVATVVDVPYKVKPNIFSSVGFYVTTSANPRITPGGSDSIPLWVYIVASLGGVLLLVILMIILWRCGFFRRKRVQDTLIEEEEEASKPLNQHSNGV